MNEVAKTKIAFFCKRQTLFFGRSSNRAKAGTIWASQDPMRYFEIVGKGEVGDLRKDYEGVSQRPLNTHHD